MSVSSLIALALPEVVSRAAGLVNLLLFVLSLHILLPILVYRHLKNSPVKTSEVLYSGLRRFSKRRAGTVPVEIHVYQGILVWVQQLHLRGYFPPDDAALLLKRSLKWNLTRGLLAYGGILIPFVAIPEYFSQRRKLRQNLEKLAERNEVYDERSGGKKADKKAPPLARSAFSLFLFSCAGLALICSAVAVTTSILMDDDLGFYMAGFGGFAALVCYLLGADLATSQAAKNAQTLVLDEA